jgi:hypothetical protein
MNKLIAISALVLGFGLGAWSGYQVGSTETPASVAHADLPALVTHEPGLSAGRADVDSSVLRVLIREEMAAVLAARASSSPVARTLEPPSKAAAPGPAKDVVTPEKLAQRHEAQEQIDAIVSQGVWGNEQRLSFQQKLVVLDPEQRERALQQITTAINNGTLQVGTDGPPL